MTRRRSRGRLATPTGNVSFTVYLRQTECSGDGLAAGSSRSTALASRIRPTTRRCPSAALGTRRSTPAMTPTSRRPARARRSRPASSTRRRDGCAQRGSRGGPERADRLGVHDRATVSGVRWAHRPASVDFTVYLGNTSARAKARCRLRRAERRRRASVERCDGARGWPVVPGALPG